MRSNLLTLAVSFHILIHICWNVSAFMLRPKTPTFLLNLHCSDGGVFSTSGTADTIDDLVTITAPSSSIRKIFVQITKPLGIVIEEIDANDPTKGVIIVQILPDGNTSTTNKQQLTKKTDFLICLGDQILQVNDIPCTTYDDVMKQIIISPSDSPVNLILGRSDESVIVQFNDNSGICVAAPPSEYLGNIANQAGISLPYSCRSGSCGSCEQSLLLRKTKPDGTEKERQHHARPCIYRIPRGIDSIQVTAPGRYRP